MVDDLARTLAELDATGQSELIASGEVTAVECVEASISACEALNPQLNAVIHPAFDRARAQAEGAVSNGPFGGVPMLVKDLVCHEAGQPFHEGSVFLKRIGHAATEDQVLATRFRDAGFVSLGRTNTPEFGMRPVCEPEAYGPTHNPWDLTRSTGGSSGGSAAAVAAGVVAVAHANDVGGSIRNPASMCGLVGLKPSRGRSCMAPDFFDAMGGLAEELVLARSVRDIAGVLDAVTGSAVGDWHAAWEPSRPYQAEVAADPSPLRIGFLTEHVSQPIDPSIVAIIRRVASDLEALGHRVDEEHPVAFDEDLSSPMLAHYTAGTAWMVDEHWPRVTGQAIPADEIEAGTAMLAEMGRSISGAAFLAAREHAQSWTRRMAAWWVDRDVFMLPTLPVLPPEIGSLSPIEDVVLLSLLGPFNLSGQPAMSLPLGEVDGLPVGVQFVAAHGREDVLLRLAAQLERAHPWAARRPPVHVASL